MNQNGQGSAPIINLRDSPGTDMLIQMCNPKVKVDDEEEFTNLWQTVREAMESIV